MPSVCRLGDATSGHDGYPATTIIEGSPDTFVNSLPVARKGDDIMIHCKKTCHGGQCMADNQHNFYVNGLPVQCVGDHITCEPQKHTSTSGSNNTNSG